MRQVGDGIHALGTRGHNFYLLREGDDCTVIDAGCSREWKKLVGGLESLGLSLSSVRGIVATHSHADHFGFARKAMQSGLSVAVHEDEKTRALGTYEGRYAATPAELPKFNLHALRNFIPMVFAGVTSLDRVDDVETFADGERLDLPGRPVAVHTPGHTEGHAMFHCPDQGLLFTGDGLIMMDLLGPRRGPQVIGDVFNLDPAQARASLDRIVDLDANLLLPGHGDPWSGSPSDAAALARA